MLNQNRKNKRDPRSVENPVAENVLIALAIVDRKSTVDQVTDPGFARRAAPVAGN
jgi:hypothetical protein